MGSDSMTGENGSHTDQFAVDALREQLLGLRSDAISIVITSERLLEAAGYPIAPAVLTRAGRREISANNVDDGYPEEPRSDVPAGEGTKPIHPQKDC